MATDSSYQRRRKSGTPQKESSVVENENRINKLPNAILSHILSMLPQKQVERTSVLSTRWRYLWALNPILKFVMPCCKSRTEVKLFMDFVKKIMDLRDGLQIEQFHFDCLENCDYDRVSALICNVLKCEVQVLNLHLHGEHEKGLSMPPALFMDCKSLVELTLCEYVAVDVPANVHFPTLKILELRLVTYSNEASIGNLVSGCPMLEKLYVERYLRALGDNVMTFSISSLSLKLLDLLFSFEEEFHECDGYPCKYKTLIDAPNLENLYLRDHISAECTINSKLPNLIKAHVDVDRSCGTMYHIEFRSENVLAVIKSISAAKSLFVSGSTLLALGLTFVDNLPVFHNLVQFSVGVDEIFGWRMLPSFLENIPNLEVLAFPYVRDLSGYLLQLTRFFIQDFKFSHYLKLLFLLLDQGIVPLDYPKYASSDFSLNFYQNVPACLVSKLKRIEINHFYGTTNDELKFIMYMLKNAKVLTTVKIDSSVRVSSGIPKKLSKIRRGSSRLLLIHISGGGDEPKVIVLSS